jgi:hypothetical protein
MSTLDGIISEGMATLVNAAYLVEKSEKEIASSEAKNVYKKVSAKTNFDVRTFRGDPWTAISDEQKREIIAVYGPEHEADLKATEGPVPQQSKSPCGVRDMRRQFRLYNPNFFYFFWYDNYVGRWKPKLGETEEIKRRQKRITRKARMTRKARQAVFAHADGKKAWQRM